MIGRSECSRHRHALSGLAERRVDAKDGQAALEHVGRCPACARTLGELMLTVVVLRRMGAEAAAVAYLGPEDDAWSRLRARIERSRQRAREQAWHWRATVGGLATAMLVVAAIVGPASIHMTATVGATEKVGDAIVMVDRLELQTELGSVDPAHRLLNSRTPDDALASGGGNAPRTMYPDGIRPDRKEVDSGRATTRLPEAG
jgi:hypothetical protein